MPLYAAASSFDPDGLSRVHWLVIMCQRNCPTLANGLPPAQDCPGIPRPADTEPPSLHTRPCGLSISRKSCSHQRYWLRLPSGCSISHNDGVLLRMHRCLPSHWSMQSIYERSVCTGGGIQSDLQQRHHCCATAELHAVAGPLQAGLQLLESCKETPLQTSERVQHVKWTVLPASRPTGARHIRPSL